MINLRQYKYLYIDANILYDDSATVLFNDLSERHVIIILILYNEDELKTVLSLESYAYVSEVLYGSNTLHIIEQDINKKKLNARRICFMHHNELENADFACVSIGKSYVYKDVGAFYEADQIHIKKLSWKLFLSIGVGILYIILYLEEVIPVSRWAAERDLIFITLYVPMIFIMLVFLYGCRKRVFSFMDLFDFFG